MADINTIVSGYIKSTLNAAVLDAAYQMSQMSACAGVRNNKVVAYKGKINHYGTYSAGPNKDVKIVARPWLNAATGTSDALYQYEKMYANNLMSAIRSSLKDSRLPSKNVLSYTNKEGLTVTDYQRVQPRFSSVSGMGPYRIMSRIAKAMATNQKSYIMDKQGDANTLYTEARKGFNHPLYKNGELVNNITYWVENGSEGNN